MSNKSMIWVLRVRLGDWYRRQRRGLLTRIGKEKPSYTLQIGNATQGMKAPQERGKPNG